MEVVDFLKVRGEQKFKEEKNLIPLEIRIKNDRMQNILEIYEKNAARVRSKGILLSSGMKNKTD